MLCAKFSWNWPIGSEKEGFHKSYMYSYMHYVTIISTDKRCVPSIEQFWILLTQVFLDSPSGLGKDFWKLPIYF